MATQRWPAPSDVPWLRPEELIRAAFARSRVVMMNEAHEGLKRCLRTRRIGVRLLPIAWECGVRALAVDLLGPPSGPPDADARLEQPDLVQLLETARRLGFRVSGYDINPGAIPLKLRTVQKSPRFTNWRDGQQAGNLAGLLGGLAPDQRMLVWCGNMHHSKVRVLQFQPMGWQFRAKTGVDPFVIDQTVTVAYPARQSHLRVLEWARQELVERGGEAGYVRQVGLPQLSPGCDAWLLSLDNEMS